VYKISSRRLRKKTEGLGSRFVGAIGRDAEDRKMREKSRDQASTDEAGVFDLMGEQSKEKRDGRRGV